MLKISKNANINYLAKLVKLDTFKEIEGANKIKIAIVDFQEVIVSKDYKKGDYVIYFPIECAINLDFLSFTNSFRDETLNKDSKKGFFDAKGRVKAMKMMGGKVKSMGYIVPVQTVFDWVGAGLTNIDKHINEEFDTINGKLICKKYIIKTKEGGSRNKQGKKPQVSRLIEGQVHLHVDTENLRKNAHKICPEDIISVTYKTHGCLPFYQKVKMWDGSTKPISKIEVGDVVLGYDHKECLYRPSKVLNTYINGVTKEWYHIKKSNNVKKLGSYQNKLVCTGNHEVFTNKGYIEASKLRVGDTIYTYNKEFSINIYTKEFLIGKMLGDASVDRGSNNWSVTYSHKKEHEDYLTYCNRNMRELHTGNVSKRISGFDSNMVVSQTKKDKSIKDLFEKWYIDGKKVIPSDLVLTSRVLAFWYMDDGSLISTNKQHDRASFAICGFNSDSVKNIAVALKKYGFSNFQIYEDKEGYYRLRLNATDASILFKDIEEFVPTVMRYKLPKYLRGKQFKEAIYENNEYIYKIYDEVITEISVKTPKETRNATKKYDIHTDTENFVSGGTLIHNSSWWVANVQVKRKLNWFEKLLVYSGVSIKDTEYDLVYGSRKVVKNKSFDDAKKGNHYYGYDIWEDIKDEVGENIPKGFTLYGEMLGYDKNGGAIQKHFDYGCDPQGALKVNCDSEILKPKHKIEVYRITFTNEDGVVFELTYPQMEEFCEKAGLKHSTLFYYGKAKNLYKDLDIDNHWHEGFIKNLERDYNEKDCYMCFNKVPEEGIVVRNERLNSCNSYKLKSFRFLEFETKQLDKGESDIESEN